MLRPYSPRCVLLAYLFSARAGKALSRAKRRAASLVCMNWGFLGFPTGWHGHPLRVRQGIRCANARHRAKRSAESSSQVARRSSRAPAGAIALGLPRWPDHGKHGNQVARLTCSGISHCRRAGPTGVATPPALAYDLPLLGQASQDGSARATPISLLA